MGGGGTLIPKVLNGVCSLLRCQNGSRKGVVLWGGQEHPAPLLRWETWGHAGAVGPGHSSWRSPVGFCPLLASHRGVVLWGRGHRSRGAAVGSALSWGPIGLQVELWGGWMEAPPPHCWGRRGSDIGPRGLQWGLSHRGPKSGVVGTNPGGLQWGLSPPGLGPVVIPSVG